MKANLCLYDIAMLCCRTDFEGEVPSRLEILIQRASELSVKAVENGRWHHTQASGAIVDSLQNNNSGGGSGSGSGSGVGWKVEKYGKNHLGGGCVFPPGLDTGTDAPLLVQTPAALSSSGSESSAELFGIEPFEGRSEQMQTRTQMQTQMQTLSISIPISGDGGEDEGGDGGGDGGGGSAPSPAKWAAGVLQDSEDMAANMLSNACVGSPSSIGSEPSTPRSRLDSDDFEPKSPTISSTPTSPPGFWRKKKPTYNSSTSPIMFSLSDGFGDDYEEGEEGEEGEGKDTMMPLELPPPSPPPQEEGTTARASVAAFGSFSMLPPPKPIVRSSSWNALGGGGGGGAGTGAAGLGVGGDEEKEALLSEYFDKFVDLLITQEIKRREGKHK